MFLGSVSSAPSVWRRRSIRCGLRKSPSSFLRVSPIACLPYGDVSALPGEAHSTGLPETAGKAAMIAAAAFPRSGSRSLCARVRVVAVVPDGCVRLQHCDGGGQLAAAYLYRQLRDLRDLRYLKRCSARNLGLGHNLIAEVGE